jgi:hypothetical protein
MSDMLLSQSPLITRKRGVWILYRLVGNIKHGNIAALIAAETAEELRGLEHADTHGAFAASGSR